EDEQDEELLEDQRLDGALGIEGARGRLIAVDLERDPEVARVREPLAGKVRHRDRDQERHDDRDRARDDRRDEHRRVVAQVGELLAEQRGHAAHGFASWCSAPAKRVASSCPARAERGEGSSSRRYTSSSGASSATTDTTSAPASTSARTMPGVARSTSLTAIDSVRSSVRTSAKARFRTSANGAAGRASLTSTREPKSRARSAAGVS